MRVVIVCTGNVARSPALACLLQLRRPDLTVESAAVGVNARSGMRMKRHMRELLSDDDPGSFRSLAAEQHRSVRWDELTGDIDCAVGVAPVHIERLEILAPDVPRLLTVPRIKDPAYGGIEGYLLAWEQIKLAAEMLAEDL